MIYIGPGLYLFSPFTVPSLTIPTSATNLIYTPRLIRTLLCLRYNIIKKMQKFKEFERKEEQRIMNPDTKYVTGVTPGRTRTVTFNEFLPKFSKEETRSSMKRQQDQERGQQEEEGEDLEVVERKEN